MARLASSQTMPAHRLFAEYPQSREVAAGKDFHQELAFFNQLIEQGKNFSLVRFGDGEMLIVEGRGIDLSGKYNGEHKYEPGNVQHETMRSLLAESLTCTDERYFVGIACPCCVGQTGFENLKSVSGQAEPQLTWANLFVNSNYAGFRQHTVDLLADRTVNIVCHEKASVSTLPFVVNKRFNVGPNSWVADFERLLGEMKTYTDQQQSGNEVFLFCAGVLSNIMVYRLTQHAPNNTYIDVGSVFDVDLGLGKTRKYLKNGRNLRKICRWN